MIGLKCASPVRLITSLSFIFQIMIVSFVFEDDFNEQKIKNVTSILKEFGIKTNQESVAFVIDGEMYYINL